MIDLPCRLPIAGEQESGDIASSFSRQRQPSFFSEAQLRCHHRERLMSHLQRELIKIDVVTARDGAFQVKFADVGLAVIVEIAFADF